MIQTFDSSLRTEKYWTGLENYRKKIRYKKNAPQARDLNVFTHFRLILFFYLFFPLYLAKSPLRVGDLQSRIL